MQELEKAQHKAEEAEGGLTGLARHGDTTDVSYLMTQVISEQICTIGATLCISDAMALMAMHAWVHHSKLQECAPSGTCPELSSRHATSAVTD